MIKNIAIVSLSSGTIGEDFVKHEVDIGIKRLNDFGLNVRFMPHALEGMEYVKNHPEKRAADLLQALSDPEIDMILCAIGGDDTYRLLPFLFEHNELADAVSDKVFLGFSDTTINHFMLHKVGMKTFYVFKDEPIGTQDYDLDHFIPHSFVMNDELWNLMPMDSFKNSKKNNRLLDLFFPKFADNQFILYEKLHEKPGVHKLYEACYRDNLHSIWANQELYRKGNTKEEFCVILDKNMHPVYDSARIQGYQIWNLS